jgi:lysophospholipase L1-like esterase
MIKTQSRFPRVLRVLSGLCLSATGFLSEGCARGPDTVIPRANTGGWSEIHNRYVDRANRGNVDLLFIGDSITEGWHKEIWNRYYGPRNAANFGIGGDKTQQILWRVQNGELDGIRPKVVVVMVGTNNLTVNTVDEIVLGIRTIVQETRRHLPKTRILLLGIFPRGPTPDPVREKLEAVNARIARLDDGSHVTYLDIGRVFVNDDGTISREIMPDFIHLSRRGYELYADAIEPTLWSMLDKPP